ncbi:MAG: hypothetical protein QJR03_02420 [Sphaerobacter sp.]|nr:hypothetical protein [Sphaerobacter sp.]
MVRNRGADDGVRRLIARYLTEVEAELADLPPAQRREILEDLQQHVEDALAVAGARDEATVRTVLDRLGPPDELAREARERLGLPPAAAAARQGPGLLEYAAVVLTALFWPVGILLAWLSPWWHTRDKVIATLIGFLGLVLLVGGLMAVRVSSVDAVRVDDVPMPQPVETRPGLPVPTVAATQPPLDHEPNARASGSAPVRVIAGAAGLLMFLVILCCPLLSAGYLAIRLRRPPAPAAPRTATQFI